MNIKLTIVSLSIILQLVSVFFAIRLILITGKRLLGALILTAISLMALRRGIVFYRIITGGAANVDISAEIIALTVSFLFLVGILYIARLISSIQSSMELTTDREKRYHTLFEQSPDGILLIDSDGSIIEFNEAAHRQLGFSKEEFAGLKLSDIDPVESPEEIQARIRMLLNGEKAAFEVKHRTKDGEIRDVQVISQAINLSGRTVFHAIWRDITERKLAEDRLEQSEQFIRNILDTVDEGFIVIDRDYRIRMTNKAYCAQAGRACHDIIGRHCYEISHNAFRPCYEEGEECAVRHVFSTGEPHTAIHRHPDINGGIMYVETKAFPVTNSSGTVVSAVETVNNITEKYLLEEERLKTQKLESIGTLAGGIAHDFNNLLQGIFGYISMAKTTLDQKERSLAMLEQAEKALHMSVNLTTQLLTFSKGGMPVTKKISLVPLIGNSVRFALSGSSRDYSIMIEDDLCAVEADEGQIGQVIQNIVLNADQAMPMGGAIVITAKNVRTPERGLPKGLEAGKYVEISVQDHGIGIPEHYMRKIFDPYFTTKEKGTGLGLATSYSIIRNHGGLIDVTSVPGKGTTFSIYLPATEAEMEVKEPGAVYAAVHKGRVLVMDDEEMIRNIAAELIKALGHEVELAETGEVAIEKYKSAGESGKPFDIVILDLTIRGGKGGRETIDELILIDNAVRAIVSSGYSDDDTVSDYHKYGFKARLTKPYQLEKLRDTINKLLNA
ncbi:MAG: PAS domain S-box protein [Nitrospirae bacterium]|nr:PAS domain S-box protein [Nitrospirota bacterium]